MGLLGALKKLGAITVPLGTLHIVAYEPSAPGATEVFGVTYTPYDQDGGALKERKFYGRDAIESFLRETVDVSQDDITRILKELASKRTAEVRELVFSDEELGRLGLSSEKHRE